MAEKFERTKPHFFVILFLIVGAGFIYAVSVNIFKTTVNAATIGVLSDEYEVDFVAGITPERVIDFTTKTNAQLISLEHSIQIGDEIFSGGYFVRAANNSKKAILNDYKSSHLSFLHDALNTRSQSSSGLSIDAQNARDHYFEAVKNEVLKGDSFQRINIRKITIRGNARIRSELSKLSFVSGIKNIPTAPDQSLTNQNVRTDNTIVNAATINASTWAPTNGISSLFPSIYGGRFVQQDVYWGSWNNTMGFGTNSTYEHEFFLNGYDGATYLNASQSSNSVPIVSYWTSNLPTYYLDTRFLNSEPREVEFTIGSAEAVYIRPFRWYTNYIRTSNGNASTDSGKINAQLGYRSPSWCYTTWCSFRDSNAPIEKIVPAWNIPVPGTYQWSR